VFALQLAGNDSLFFSLADLSVVPSPLVLKPIRTFFEKLAPVSLDRPPAASELLCGFTDL